MTDFGAFTLSYFAARRSRVPGVSVRVLPRTLRKTSKDGKWANIP
jgi:hypothetical protein